MSAALGPASASRSLAIRGECGPDEQTSGLAGICFPKKTDFRSVSDAEVREVVDCPDARSRNALLLPHAGRGARRSLLASPKNNLRRARCVHPHRMLSEPPSPSRRPLPAAPTARELRLAPPGERCHDGPNGDSSQFRLRSASRKRGFCHIAPSFMEGVVLRNGSEVVGFRRLVMNSVPGDLFARILCRKAQDN